MNALHLNAACLSICEPHEALDCVEAIIAATDAINELVDQIDALPEPVA